MRKLLTSAAIVAALFIALPTAAQAVETSASPSATTDPYPVDESTEPSLAGSTAVGECDGDVPWISYSVELFDPDNLSTAHTATLVLSGSGQTKEIPLGALVDNKLQGRVIWPGASVDDAGNPTGWPGWEFTNGQWVETNGNFAWTRGAITATLKVNPETTVALSYPPATPVCAVSPSSAAAGAAGAVGSLPATGLDTPVLALSVGGGLVVLMGAVLLIVRRRARA